jgi:hypothetical protein
VRAGERQVLVVTQAARIGGAIVGRVVDGDGVPVAAKVALSHLRPGSAFTTTDPHSGRFRFARLPPAGAFWTINVEDDAKRAGARDGLDVVAGKDLDVGDITVAPPGRVRVSFASDGAGSDSGPLPAGTGVCVSFPSGAPADVIRLTGRTGLSWRLPPGDYVVHVISESVAQSPTRVTVRSNEECSVVFPAIAAWPRTFTFAHPEDAAALHMDLRWRDAQGGLLCVDSVSWQFDQPLAARQAFAAGTYRLEAVSHSGLRAEAAFEVDPGIGDEPMHLELR